MRKLSLLLLLSLVTNVVLVGFVFLRLSPPGDHPTDKAASAIVRAGHADHALLGTLKSGDLAQLKAAGLSEEVARGILVGRAYSRYHSRMKALVVSSDPQRRPYWRGIESGPEIWDKRRQQMEAYNLVQKELNEAVASLYGPQAELLDENDSPTAFLSEEKRAKYDRIQDDYRRMEQELNINMRGIVLASDVAHRTLLEKEKAKDIAALLTPEEREQLELRGSDTATALRFEYGNYIDSEDVYRKVYALRKAFDEKYGDLPAELVGTESFEHAYKDMTQAIRDVVGSEKVAQIEAEKAAQARENDPEHRVLNALTERLNLAPNTREQVLAKRTAYATESMRIINDPVLSVTEQQSRLRSLGLRAAAEIQSLLGAEGSSIYVQRTGWITALGEGGAFSTTPINPSDPDEPWGSVYLVAPPKDKAPPKE